MIVRFDVVGMMRFVSHAEMVRVFQRACVRASIDLKFSGGFNPRPKMSVPLPRTVGLASEGDVLFLIVIGVGGEPVVGDLSEFDLSGFAKRLSAELPGDCRIRAVEVSMKNSPPNPTEASYVIELAGGRGRDIEAAAAEIMGRESIVVGRSTGKGRARQVDVRPFLKEIECDESAVTVRYGITPTGSIRFEEVLELLGIGGDDSPGPMRRTNVKWN